MHTIRNQYNLIATTHVLESDFNAMLDWLEHWEMKPCKSEYFGEEVNAVLVNNWITFRASLSNTPKCYEREFLESNAIEYCDAEDLYELRDVIGEMPDGQLMAIGRLFYTDAEVIQIKSEPVTTIAVEWGIEDVQSVRPDLTDEQASEVLQAADRCHNAEIGINWEVLEIHADSLYPKPDDLDEDESEDVDTAN